MSYGLYGYCQGSESYCHAFNYSDFQYRDRESVLGPRAMGAASVSFLAMTCWLKGVTCFMNRRRVEVQTEQADSCPSIVRSVGRVLKEAMLFGGAAAVGTIALSALPWAQDRGEGTLGTFLGASAGYFLSAVELGMGLLSTEALPALPPLESQFVTGGGAVARGDVDENPPVQDEIIEGQDPI